MKKVIVAALLVVGITAFAQEKKERKFDGDKLTKEEKVDLQVKRMTKDLNLNEEQTKQVQALVAKEVDKREAKRAEMQQKKAQEKDKMRAEMEANQSAFSAEVKKILTPEQYAKWEKTREERKEKMKERMSNRMKKRAPENLPESK
ncbi:MAG TPA: hypothetical protein PKN96_02850 [Flavobacterium sp.]|uniref:hypothetical protein n=1 Tax=Flavobacterium sp. TaxID=239 RepID=UPI002CAB4A64|nr:hypothetical protein [Flavobacterium sp.]HNP32214.1 hypothetical protein [Flavobacterium sp.]